MRYLTALIAAFALSGCVASNLTQLADAMSKDKATVYMSVTSIYGSAMACRTNSQSAGGEVTAGGNQCTIKSYGPVAQAGR